MRVPITFGPTAFTTHLLLVALFLVAGAVDAAAQDSESHGQLSVVVYLVRHAERADDGTTRDPPLSDAGRERVELLRRVLGDVRLSHVHTTDLQRTRNTAQPFADDNGVELSIYDPFRLNEFAGFLKSTPGRHLVSGHSNTTPQLVEALGGNPHGEIQEGEYDRLYVVVILPTGPPVTTLLRFGRTG